MPINENENKAEPTVLDVAPLSLGKRILAYLADFFICFIFALSLFHMAALPLAKASVDFNGRMEESISAASRRDSVLYGNKLLFATSSENEKSEYFAGSLLNTYDIYLKSLVLGESEGTEVFKHYFVDIRNDYALLKSFYTSLDEKTSFFDISDSAVTLKNQYVEEFKPYFDAKDTMSAQGASDYQKFQSKIFLQGYSDLINDILENDLTYNGISYKAMQAEVEKVMDVEKYVILASAASSMLIAMLIDFALVPFINKGRKTIGMLALKIERVNSKTLVLEKRRNILIHFGYGLLFNLGSLVFVPWGAVGFNELFSLPFLFPISAVSLLAAIISLFYLLFDHYNRTLSDLLSSSVLITSDDLSKIYRAKGYTF